jgi:hypothetical protein
MKTFSQLTEDIAKRRLELRQRQLKQMSAQKERVASYQSAQKERQAAAQEREALKKEIKRELQTEQVPQKSVESVDENVSSGRAKVRNVKQRVSSAEVITNTERQNQVAKHFADHASRKKASGDEAHAAATKAGKSPMEAETARQRAHRNYEKQMKNGL